MEEVLKIGKRIGDYMESNGIKKTFVADRAGMRSDSFSRANNGGRAFNCLEYYKVCKALGVPLETFITE